MAISLEKQSSIREYAVALATNCRLFTLEQVGTHPLLRGLTQPSKKASAILRQYPEDFEKCETPFGKPARFRLSEKLRKELKIKTKQVPGNSLKSEHWIEMGNLWITLTQAGGRPTIWKTEPGKSGEFDIFCVWQKHAYLIEVQRTEITTTKWNEKWEKRLEWFQNEGFMSTTWQSKEKPFVPKVCCVNLTGKYPSGAIIPFWVTMANTHQELSSKLLRKHIAEYAK